MKWDLIAIATNYGVMVAWWNYEAKKARKLFKWTVALIMMASCIGLAQLAH